MTPALDALAAELARTRALAEALRAVVPVPADPAPAERARAAS